MKFRYREPHEMKDSGVEWLGMIPKEWEIKPLKRIYEKIIDYRGKTPKKVESGIQLVTAKNIKNGIIDYEISKEYVQEIEFDKIMQRGKVKINDLLFTTEAPLGELALVDREDFALAQRIILFRFYDSNIAKFSKYLLSSKLYKDYLYSNSSGSTALGIKGSKVPGLIYIQPNKYDLINSFLDQKTAEFDNIIAKKQAFIEKLTEAKKSLISEVVTGKKKVTPPPNLPLSQWEEQKTGWKMENRKAEDMKDSGVEWLGMIPKEWESKKLGYLFNFKNGVNADSTAYGSGIKFINLKEILKYKVLKSENIEGQVNISPKEIKDNLVKYGDILFNRTSETREEIALTTVYEDTEPVVFGGFVIKGTPINKLLSFGFKKYCFNSNEIRNQLISFSSGSIRKNIGQSNLKDVYLPITSIEEQEKIGEYLDITTLKIENIIKKTKLQIEKLKEAKQSLISEAVTGKIEVM